ACRWWPTWSRRCSSGSRTRAWSMPRSWRMVPSAWRRLSTPEASRCGCGSARTRLPPWPRDCVMPAATASAGSTRPSSNKDNRRMDPANDADPALSGTATTTPGGKPPVASLRALWPFVRAHRGLFAAWMVALACSSSATLALPVAVREMIDQGFAAGGGAAIDRAFMLLFAVALVLALATAARFYFVSLLGERVVADLRRRLYAHLVSLDAAFFDRTRSGELVSRLTADAELLRSVVATSMSVALRSTVTFVGSILMLFITAPGLATYALVGIPFAVLPIVIGGRRLQKMSRQSQDRVADANTFATETLGAVS